MMMATHTCYRDETELMCDGRPAALEDSAVTKKRLAKS